MKSLRVCPLSSRAPDAVYLDTTGLAPETVVDRMLDVVEGRRPASRGR
jgi:cytidylate kinase